MNEVIHRLTSNGRTTLLQLAQDEPELWQNPETDFDAELRKVGCTYYAEPTTALSNGTIALPTGEGYSRQNSSYMDRNAPVFLDTLRDLTPEQASDGRLWEWLCHFRLHAYCCERWPNIRNSNQLEYIQLHWFVRNRHGNLYQDNTASRTYWVGVTSERIARASSGTLTKQQVAEHLSENPITYHSVMRSNMTHNPRISALVMEAMMTDSRGKGISSEGAIALWKRLNLMAGKMLPEAMTDQEWNDIIDGQINEVMTETANVKTRWDLRGKEPYRVLSLGAGAQSTTLALMADRGEYGLPKPDVAIFADTGWEPAAVYEHLEWLEKELSFPVVRTGSADIKENLINGVMPNGSNFIGIPAYTVGANGETGIMRRQCTTEYKLKPIHRKVREMLGLTPLQAIPKNIKVEMWIGISVDEIQRAKPSREEWIAKRFPLIDRGFHRAQLHGWFQEHYPDRVLPKSACIGCPYHSDAVWKDMKEHDPESFMEAVRVDIALRENPSITKLTPNAQAFLHQSRKPLAVVDFDDTNGYQDQMNEECDGICGI